jgi:hypothetical protein
MGELVGAMMGGGNNNSLSNAVDQARGYAAGQLALKRRLEAAEVRKRMEARQRGADLLYQMGLNGPDQKLMAEFGASGYGGGVDPKFARWGHTAVPGRDENTALAFHLTGGGTPVSPLQSLTVDAQQQARREQFENEIAKVTARVTAGAKAGTPKKPTPQNIPPGNVNTYKKLAFERLGLNKGLEALNIREMDFEKLASTNPDIALGLEAIVDRMSELSQAGLKSDAAFRQAMSEFEAAAQVKEVETGEESAWNPMSPFDTWGETRPTYAKRLDISKFNIGNPDAPVSPGGAGGASGAGGDVQLWDAMFGTQGGPVPAVDEPQPLNYGMGVNMSGRGTPPPMPSAGPLPDAYGLPAPSMPGGAPAPAASQAGFTVDQAKAAALNLLRRNRIGEAEEIAQEWGFSLNDLAP